MTMSIINKFVYLGPTMIKDNNVHFQTEQRIVFYGKILSLITIWIFRDKLENGEY